jgi:hypothetical protein
MKRSLIIVAVLAVCGSLAVALDDIATPGSDFYGRAVTAAVDSGAAVSGVASSVATEDQVIKRVITFSCTGANDIDLDDGADGNGVKIFDFEEGSYTILGALIDSTAISSTNFNASANDLYYLSVGTAAAANGDADLTSTEANIIPKTTIDTVSGMGSQTNAFDAVLAAPLNIDGTATASDIYVNASIAATANTAANTVAVNGTITLFYVKHGDK